MKGRQHPSNDVALNPSDNESIRDVISRVDQGRRRFLQGSVSAGVVAALGGVTLGGFVRSVSAAPVPQGVGFAGIGFESVPPNLLNSATGVLEKDLVSVPAGYRAEVLVAWGDPIMPGARNWDVSATQSAAEQERQYGMHNDGMHYFPLAKAGQANPRANLGVSDDRGLLVVNHEYTDENQLHGTEGLTGGAGVTIQKVRKSQAAHGVSVIETFKAGKQWQVQRGSKYGRRITANTPMRVSGPAAGLDMLKSKKYYLTPDGSVDSGMLNDGYTAYGTANNCAHGYTPWGTYLTCEENWNGYFGAAPAAGATKDERRLGITSTGFGYSWHTVDDRWDIRKNPNEQNLFGWRVEIDPFDPDSVPVKRTALGRFKAESAQVVVDDANRVAFYMGDDERNEYIYKFVCARAYNPTNRTANRDMLDHGTLYVAKFRDDGTGAWLALVPDAVTVIDDGLGGKKKLRDLADFAGADDREVQGKICVRTRMAADAVGATMMDRPEWCAARPRVGGFTEIEVYCTLTNNSRRGNTPASSNRADGTSGAASSNPPVELANPRPDNDYGHIIRWRETGRTVTATSFAWDLFVQCGDKQNASIPKVIGGSYNKANLIGVATDDPDFSRKIYQGNINGDDYGAPDGLWFDDYGRLWIQTDQAGDGQGDWKNIGGNVMMCADPNSGATRRFLTSPTDCEVTGVITTPDHRTMFVNIQHPGDRGTPSEPTLGSNWPHSQGYGPSGRPRSATVVITKDDGGIIGT
jgi:secreted PhoX family phosphatase